jgi:SWI/SNF-related matrix-associated actin-dependent regulator 1 of chromatin subfamily A
MKLAERAPHVLCMTGTPITNRPAELWPLLHMIDERAWPKFWAFGQRYCDAQNNGFGWDFSGASNLAELHEAIKPYCIRRTKAQVLSELPEKRRAQVAVEFDEAVRDEYIKLLAQAERMAQATEAEQLVFIEKAKQVTARAKLPAVLDWISDFLETGEKLVVFCTHTETVEALMGKFGVQAVEITGRVTGEARQRAVDEFQGNDKIRLLVGNIRAAGEGITLTASSNVAFVEYPQTPGALEQAIDRVHRIGQRSAVTAWFLMADGTIDEDVIELLERKRQVIGLAVDGQAQEGAIAGELIKRIISLTNIL